MEYANVQTTEISSENLTKPQKLAGRKIGKIFIKKIIPAMLQSQLPSIKMEGVITDGGIIVDMEIKIRKRERGGKSAMEINQ